MLKQKMEDVELWLEERSTDMKATLTENSSKLSDSTVMGGGGRAARCVTRCDQV